MPPAARRFYLDSSAYLCILLGEDGHEPLTRELRGSQLLSSSLLVLEVQRNLVRMSREALLSADDLQNSLDRFGQDLELFLLRDLTLELCLDREMPVVSTPRSLDLAHLRTALWFDRQEPIHRFVTRDLSQRQSAREFRLPI